MCCNDIWCSYIRKQNILNCYQIHAFLLDYHAKWTNSDINCSRKNVFYLATQYIVIMHWIPLQVYTDVLGNVYHVITSFVTVICTFLSVFQYMLSPLSMSYYALCNICNVCPSVHPISMSFVTVTCSFMSVSHTCHHYCLCQDMF